MRLTIAFLWACLIVAVLLGMMALVPLASESVQPLTRIGEPMCIQPDGSVCAFLEDAR